MTATKPGLAAVVDLEAPCTCRCPRSGHRLLGAGVYGGCRVHGKCQRFELDEHAAAAAATLQPVDQAELCGCGARRGQHIGDDGRLRCMHCGCQDFHTVCDTSCKHRPPVLHRATVAAATPVQLREHRHGPAPQWAAPTDVPKRLIEEPLPPAEPEDADAPATPPADVPELAAPAGGPADAGEAQPAEPAAGSAPDSAVGAKSPRHDPRPDTGSRDGDDADQVVTAATGAAAVTTAPEPAPAAPATAAAAASRMAARARQRAAAPAPGRKRPPAKTTGQPSPELTAAIRLVVTQAVDMYPAWYCRRCEQRRLQDGKCPACHSLLLPVHVLVVPRELP
ncbi:hypothetical protein ABT297_04205 [Dactylosporangium sp. NPDC000555]|uniref:hypothetical protein n=1 Tax=Dactylosporangium sp. NPDC000555 TaxID=3154260 RepID=UPI00331F3C03